MELGQRGLPLVETIKRRIEFQRGFDLLGERRAVSLEPIQIGEAPGDRGFGCLQGFAQHHLFPVGKTNYLIHRRFHSCRFSNPSVPGDKQKWGQTPIGGDSEKSGI
jgi:hypothetical protein